MKSPWLNIPLEDYEAHMALPDVGQAQLLSQLLGQAIHRYRPSSIALLGCAGGNGFEQVPGTSVERVVGIDLNKLYLDQAEARYRTKIPSLQLIEGDLAVDRFDFPPVDMIFAGLIFEYVETTALLVQAKRMLSERGTMITTIQLPGDVGYVTPSTYSSLKSLGSVIRPVDPEALDALAAGAGFELVDCADVNASGGKQFRVKTFSRAR